MTDIGPTPERLRKSEHWDRPETDAKTNRKAHRSLDDVTRAWRAGKLEFPHLQAWEHFVRSWEGAQGYDVRITDTTGTPGPDDVTMPAWQFHGLRIAAARSDLTPRQFTALELAAIGWEFKQIGFQFSAYKSRQQAEAYALAIVEDGLERLALLWGLKRRETRMKSG